MTPRPYQLDCIADTQRAFTEFNRVLDVLPTGAGKTIIFSFLAKERHDHGQRTLIMAHREELIDQAIAKLHAATGIQAEKEKAEFCASLDAPVVVASIQTMMRRLDRWPRDHFRLVVCDEAHHALSDSWQSVLKHFEPANVLGVTATPDRGDQRNLGQYFQTIGYEITLFDLIKQGYLSRIAIQSLPLQIDLSKVHSTAGDFDSAELGSALEPYLDQIAAAIRDHAPFRRTLAFLPLINTSQKFVAACQAAGLTACHVDGMSPDRREILDRFNSWEFDVLSNAMLLTEGFDDPGIDCVCVLRPTRSRPLYAQMVGRGTRLHPGKSNLMLLDFLWMHERHNVAVPAHLIAKDDIEADQITELSRSPGLPADIAEQMPMDLETLAGEATAKREEALRKHLEKQRKKQAKHISAEDFAMQHNSLAVAEYQEVMGWEKQAITEKQSKWLKRAGIDLATVRSKGHASQLLDIYFAKKPLTLASSSQRSMMGRMGYPNAEHATPDDARRFFANLRKPKTAEFQL